MKKKVMLFFVLLGLSIPVFANSASFEFGGNIAYHNDVVFIDFTLNNDATDVRVWTDSFDYGAAEDGNFDPITALWASTGALIAENDDDDTIGSGQTYYDSGFSLPSLAAGSYSFSIACYDNFANGEFLSDGFLYDNDTPILLGAWEEADVSTDGVDPDIGTYWHVMLDGVDSASHQVPEPASMILLGFGLMGVAAYRRRMK